MNQNKVSYMLNRLREMDIFLARELHKLSFTHPLHQILNVMRDELSYIRHLTPKRESIEPLTKDMIKALIKTMKDINE